MKNQKCTEMNALVIDDNEVNLLVLTNILEIFGISTEQADSGHKALELIQKKTYNLIFVDHLMPEMDGILTTSLIRSTLPAWNNSVIIALSSEITEQTRKKYRFVGANDVYVKPLERSDLLLILRKWFPNIEFNEAFQEPKQPDHDISKRIRRLLEDLKEIDYTAAIIDVNDNPLHFIHILEATLKDLQFGINMIVNGYRNESMKLLQMSIHKLKGIFGNIGATGLLEKTITFENLILEENMVKINSGYESFLKALEEFKEKLCYSLKKTCTSERADESEYIPLSNDEYEQCLLNTIYYIRRYDYDAIVRELERLILQGYDTHRQEYESALKDIRDFEYEKALERILQLKNETGNLPVPENNKIIQLENFWNEE